MANLYIVATPIGNLEDISLRALRILKEVDLILCEDTRITQKLLNHYQIQKPLLSYHQHSKLQKINYIISLLKEGKNLALVSDSGTPGISDPGNKLISILVNEFMSNKKLKDSSTHQLINSLTIIPIPGPSALTCAASVSGFPMDRFLFLGFLPKKKKRKEVLKEILESKYPVIFYESPYRIIKTLKELGSMNKEVGIVVAKELTKKFETIYRGKVDKVIEELEKSLVKGEFVVIVKSNHRQITAGQKRVFGVQN
jgi:16S rRNA (cytidine1402-2'-O)-methyltransferase